MDSKKFTGEHSLGSNIKKALRKAGKKQQDLADHCDVDKSHVSKWCNNVNRPNSDYLNMIAEFTGRSVEEILSGVFKEEKRVFDDKSTSSTNGSPFMNEYAKKELESIMNLVDLLLNEGASPDDKKVGILKNKIENLVGVTT